MTDQAPAPTDVTHACFTPGAVWRQVTVTRDAAYQASRLEACGVDPARWAGIAEPTLFGNDNFRLLSAAGAPIDGFVHMAQRIRQTRPIALGEALTLGGRCAHAETRPNGAFFVQEFTLSDATGQVVLTAEHHRLKPAPKAATRQPAGAPALETPNFTETARRTMTPDTVTLFSSDVGNLLHSDPDFAQAMGFRAPIAQGLMAMVWMMGELARRGRRAPSM
ncbi:MAG: hypothetical protein ACPGVX_11045 [Thalassobaculaceae bacterium]